MNKKQNRVLTSTRVSKSKYDCFLIVTTVKERAILKTKFAELKSK